MWQPLSKLLSALGRMRMASSPRRLNLEAGNPLAHDVLDSPQWKEFLEPARLYDIWGPVPDSPWVPYHCVPLFAALSTFPNDKVGPTDPEWARAIESGDHLGRAPSLSALGDTWSREGVWLILDLPGTQSVTLAARLIAGGYQPVCTFDHWPHPVGVLKPEKILAQLLRYASGVRPLRASLTPSSPPVWICDRDRLGGGPGRPKEFDNRYYLDDSILPAPEILRSAGIQHILCVVPSPAEMPGPDLRAYFRDLRKQGFAAIHGVALTDPALAPFEFAPETFEISFSRSGFARSDAGGFGRLVPEPSSSSG
jgi:hypothetical protein